MSFTAQLKAGIAIYNASEFHAAHDPWEDEWRGLKNHTPDEQFLHGLIQFTAAIYHATNGNWDGAVGLATSARTYLSALPTPYQHVHLEPARAYLTRLAVDPELIERTPPPTLTYQDTSLTYDDLTPHELFIVAPVLAEEYAYDETIIDDAITYAEPALEANETNPFLALLTDFVTTAHHRDLIMTRLTAHVNRRRAQTNAVDDLFDP